MYKGIGFGKKAGEHFEIPNQAKKIFHAEELSNEEKQCS